MNATAVQAHPRFGKTTHEFVTTMGKVRRNGISIFEKKAILDSFSNDVTLDMVQESKKRFEAKNQPVLAASCKIALEIFSNLKSEVISEGLLIVRSDKE